MLRQILTVAALAGVFGTAHGQAIEIVSQAAEVPLVELDVPATEGGLVKFAVCEGCETHSVVMSGSTTYVVNDRPVTFKEFAAAVATAKESAEIARRSLAGLHFEIASKRLVKIALVTPLPQ
jgi:hypothetical protein